MHQIKKHPAILLSAVVSVILAGCGGGGESDLPAKPKFTSQVSFGDSLSDVGSYRVASLQGGMSANGLSTDIGQFTINAAAGIRTNWTEITAASLGLPAPCAAAVGGFGVPRAPATGTVADCFGYAQGGARVSDAAGYGNAGSSSGVFIGPMTESISTQITNHLAAISNKFSGEELVLVMGGANDVFVQADNVTASMVAGFSQASAVSSAETAMQQAATKLAEDVKNRLIPAGAKYVVVANIPDIASTPLGGAVGQAAAGLLDRLVTVFNTQLKAELPDSANVLNVDAYSASKDEVAHKEKYLLTNVDNTSCNISYGVAPFNILATASKPGSSLVCNATNLKTGVSPADHYLFADLVHPTPYGHALFATYVLQAMVNKGWY